MRLRRAGRGGFTLLEVMVAMLIFFMSVFAILELMSRCMRAARVLNRPAADPASIAAELVLTNAVEEGVESGDFGDLYPGAQWTREITEVATGGLYQATITVAQPMEGTMRDSTLTLLLFRPQSGRPGALRSRFAPGPGVRR